MLRIRVNLRTNRQNHENDVDTSPSSHHQHSPSHETSERRKQILSDYACTIVHQKGEPNKKLDDLTRGNQYVINPAELQLVVFEKSVVMLI
jgi:hypothetical protein